MKEYILVRDDDEEKIKLGQFYYGTYVCADELIRCRDCKYRNKATINEKGYTICPASGMEITDNDYCSFGVEEEVIAK